MCQLCTCAEGIECIVCGVFSVLYVRVLSDCNVCVVCVLHVACMYVLHNSVCVFAVLFVVYVLRVRYVCLCFTSVYPVCGTCCVYV